MENTMVSNKIGIYEYFFNEEEEEVTAVTFS